MTTKEDIKIIPYGRQSIEAGNIAAVVEALQSDFLTTGPCVDAFETALAEYCGAKHAIAVANGTAALHIAMLASGIGPGQRVLTSANTFLASANCAEFVGATADFADIDHQSYNVTADTLAAAWKPDVAAVVAVDFAGQPCDMPAIATLARQRGAMTIEDAAHAIGSEFEHEGQRYKVGGHPWADMTTFSFHPVKTITTGEGGAITTNNDELAHRCRLFRNHGMQKTRPEEPWFYEMQAPGYNYRFTDIQCALGLSQLQHLDCFIKRRQEIVDAYQTALRDLTWMKLPVIPHVGQNVAWHLFVVQIDFAVIGTTRAQFMKDLAQKGIGSQVHYIPVHLQPYYRNKYGYASGKCPVAEAYYQCCLSLPLYPLMSDTDVQRVIAAVGAVVGGVELSK